METTKNVTLGFNQTVHLGYFYNGKFAGVACGAEFTKSQYQRITEASETNHELTCKRCIKKSKKNEGK